MKRTYRYFFYDFDGMLADTYPHIAATFVRAMKELRGKDIDYEEAFELFNITYAHAYAHYNVTDEERAYFMALNEDLRVEPRPELFPHAEAVLRKAMQRGCKNFIYTNRGDFLYRYLEFFGIADCFEDCVISARKPDPQSLLAMLEKHGIDPAEAVVVGDRALDVEGGFRAGVEGILFNPIGRVKEHCAKYVITDLSELYDFIP